MVVKAKEAFTRETRKQDGELNLAYAALLIAEHLTDAVDVSLYLSLLDDIAAQIKPQLRATDDPEAMIKVINDHLFDELKFAGNVKNYYHPDNSFLNKVLDMRLGIPISLSAIYLEIGWRLNLPLWGVGLPGHFVVGYGEPDEPFYIDVFGRGRILTKAECAAIAQGNSRDSAERRAQYLKPVSKKAILYRMLLNLKQIYVGTENWDIAYKVVDMMLTINSRQITEWRDRGLIAYRLNRLHSASLDIERYLYYAPDSPDADWLKEHLEMMEKKLILLN